MDKFIAYAFWVLVTPFMLAAGTYVVGATVEHFTP